MQNTFPEMRMHLPGRQGGKDIPGRGVQTNKGAGMAKCRVSWVGGADPLWNVDGTSRSLSALLKGLELSCRQQRNHGRMSSWERGDQICISATAWQMLEGPVWDAGD